MNYDQITENIARDSGKLDSNESVYFARELEHIRAKAYDVKKAPLNALAVMPVDTSAGEAAEYITYRQYDGTGMAKIIANYADDLPRADVTGKEFTSPVRSIGNAYGYTVQDIRAGSMTGKSLPNMRQMQAKKSHDVAVNKYAWVGDADSGLGGLLTNSNIPTYTIPADGTGSSKLFSTKTADQIIRDVNGLINSMITTTKGVHTANEVWMDNNTYALIASMPRSTTTDTTVLEFLRQVHPGVTFRNVLELGTTATGGLNGATNTMIALENSVENYQLNVPMFFKQLPPESRNLEFVVNCESRFGGVTIEYPLAFVKADSV